MDRIYEITPEMLNLSWRQNFQSQSKHAVVYLVLALIVTKNSHGLWMIVGEAACIALISAAFLRPLSRVRLHITDNTVEDLDGPSISKGDIVSVAETTEGCPGIEVIGRRKPSWLPKHSIFIPAALPDYDDIKKTLVAWQFTESHVDQ